MNSTRREGKARPYAAFAVDENGVKTPLHATKIVVDLEDGYVEIDLVVSRPALSGQLPVRASEERLLAIRHGDASSVHVSVLSSAQLRRMREDNGDAGC